MDLRVQRRHKKREGEAEREAARVFYIRLSPVPPRVFYFPWGKVEPNPQNSGRPRTPKSDPT